MAVSGADRVTADRKDSDTAKLEARYRAVLAKNPGSDDAALLQYETALLGLSKIYQNHHKALELAHLVEEVRTQLSAFAKAKTAKLVRQLLDLLSEVPGTVDLQIMTIKSCIEWAVSERRTFLKQNLETRLVILHMQRRSFYEALSLINSLLKALRKLDDKLILVEVQLLESRVYHSLGNQSKARASLSSARTSAASVYTPPILQAGLDMHSGKLHAEERDFNTAFSYFIEALEGYHAQDDSKQATAALQYMLLCKIMLNLVEDVNSLMTSKHAIRYSSRSLDAMKAVAKAHSARSLEQYEEALYIYRTELASDHFIARHLQILYDTMLEQNLIKVVEPFSRVEIEHVAKMVGLDEATVEKKLGQMILDRIIVGVLDQGAGSLIIFDETDRDKGFEAAASTISNLTNVVELLYSGQASNLE